MIKNYLKIAWRNLWNQKVFSLINILGLSLGVAFTLLMGAYVWGEMQVNLHNYYCGTDFFVNHKGGICQPHK